MMKENNQMVDKGLLVPFVLVSLLFLMWGVANNMNDTLLAVASAAAIVCTMIVIFCGGWTAVRVMVAISVCMSLMFPTIYGIALDGVSGETAKIAASGLIMAILGDAIITPLKALVSARYDISESFFIPAACFLAVLVYSLGIFKKNTNVSKQ